MKKYFLLFFLILFNNEINATEKENIIQNLENIKNLSFNFEQDIDGDDSIGVDLSNLEAITTDTYGVELKRGSGSLYIVDGDTTLKIRDDYGNPRLEDSNSWEGGSYSSVGYAAEKKAAVEKLEAVAALPAEVATVIVLNFPPVSQPERSSVPDAGLVAVIIDCHINQSATGLQLFVELLLAFVLVKPVSNSTPVGLK